MFTSCSDAESNIANIWNCNKCRQLPNKVEELASSIYELHNLLSHLTEKQNDMNHYVSYILEIKKLENEVKLLKSENLKLRLRNYNRFSNTSSSSKDSSSCDEYTNLESDDCGSPGPNTSNITNKVDLHQPRKLADKAKALKTANEELIKLLQVKENKINELQSHAKCVSPELTKHQ